jgi:hypothetical protein
MYRLIAIDQTSHWRADIQRQGGKIFSRYVYDDESVTFCCEVTASRELNFVGYESTNAPENDDEREKFSENLIEAECEEDPVTYMWAFRADQLPSERIEADSLEDAIEYCRCNVFLPREVLKAS